MKHRSTLAILALSLCCGLAPLSAARAQDYDFGPIRYEVSRPQIEHALAASGFRLLSQLTRNGGIYLVDVLAPRGDTERLIIDARSGRIIERFYTRAVELAYAPSPGWFGGAFRDAPAPPAPILAPPQPGAAGIGAGGVGAIQSVPLPAPAPARVAEPQSERAPPALPRSVRAAPPKPKPHVVRRYVPAASAPTKAEAPKVESIPARVAPDSTAAPLPSAAPVVEAPSVAAPAPAAVAAQPTPPPKAAGQDKKSLNDLPVDPLE